jgi:hypothetical protein
MSDCNFGEIFMGFDKESEMAFQVDYGFTDDYGEDYPDYQFSEDLYNGYLNFINNFDNILADIEARKQKLMSTVVSTLKSANSHSHQINCIENLCPFRQ